MLVLVYWLKMQTILSAYLIAEAKPKDLLKQHFQYKWLKKQFNDNNI